MTAKNFPDSPSTNEPTSIEQRDFYYDGANWSIVNTSAQHTAAFDAANAVNTLVYSYSALANVPNTVMQGPLNIVGNVYINANSTTVTTQDILRIETGAGQTGNALLFLDSGGNTVWRILPNGRHYKSIFPQAPGGGEREKPIGMWFVERLGQDFGTASTGNNRSGLKFVGIPGKHIAYRILAVGWANSGTGTTRGTAGFQFGALLSANVYGKGAILRLPTSIEGTAATYGYWSQAVNTAGANIANTVSLNAPQARTPVLMTIDGIVEFAANSANNSEAPNVEVGFGSETGGAILLGNSCIMYMVL